MKKSFSNTKRMQNLNISYLAFVFCLMSFSLSFAQEKNTVTEDYILKYRDIALQNEKDYKIPASITMAQGIIESGSGRSSLAKEGNNHFGIKCHNSWQGKRMYKDDDKKDDCFRVYDNAEESFTDHSLFLSKGKRYQNLFSLDKNDYKSWANGLKQAGYATNPQYANLLINIIEVYDLDKLSSKDYYLVKNNPTSRETEINPPSQQNISTETSEKQPKEDSVRKKSLLEKIFGKTKWWQHRHETKKQRERRKMDEKIQKMIDKQDVQRNDFEIEWK